MEFWRCINLYHLCTYVLADKTRATYSFDNFVVPVATAFGQYDGFERLGMLLGWALTLALALAPTLTLTLTLT